MHSDAGCPNAARAPSRRHVEPCHRHSARAEWSSGGVTAAMDPQRWYGTATAFPRRCRPWPATWRVWLTESTGMGRLLGTAAVRSASAGLRGRTLARRWCGTATGFPRRYRSIPGDDYSEAAGINAPGEIVGFSIGSEGSHSGRVALTSAVSSAQTDPMSHRSGGPIPGHVPSEWV